MLSIEEVESVPCSGQGKRGGIGPRVPDWFVAVVSPRLARPLVFALRAVMKGTGQVLVFLAWCVFISAMAYLMPQNFDPVFTVLALPGVAVGVVLVTQTRRIREGLASLTLTPELCGRCLLYFRSFKHDGSTPAPRPGSLERMWLFSLFGKVMLSHEGELARDAPFLRPLVALGPPGERLPPGGALRLYFSHASWESGVAHLLSGVELAILKVGDTASLANEMALLTQAISPARVVLFNPDPRSGDYAKFRQAAERHLPHGLPEEWPVWWPPFLIFDEEWRPSPLPDVELKRASRTGLGEVFQALVALFKILYGWGKVSSNDYRLRFQVSHGDYKDTLRWLMARANGRNLDRYDIVKRKNCFRSK